MPVISIFFGIVIQMYWRECSRYKAVPGVGQS